MKIQSRRDFLKYTALTATGVGLSSWLASCTGDNTSTTTLTGSGAGSTTSSTGAGTGFTPAGTGQSGLNYNRLDPRNLANFVNPLNLPGAAGALGILEASPDKPVEIQAQAANLELLAGTGKKAALEVYQANYAGKTYLNPILLLKKGTTFSVNILNNLSEPTNIHWHGLQVDWQLDGNPARPINPGATFPVKFAVQNRGGTYWYHPHPHQFTARQAYSGLASFLIVEDDDSQRLNQALDLKLGQTDLPVVIQDKVLDPSGQLVYYPSDFNTQFMGMLGEVILANLAVNPSLDVASRLYRFRLLNGSNARSYRLAFVKNQNQEQLPYWLIGTDGGLLEKPYQVTQLFLSPGERVDVLVDFSKLTVGEVVALKSLAFDPMHYEVGMGGGMMGSYTAGNMMGSNNYGMMGSGAGATRLADGQEFFILKLVVKTALNYDRALPSVLSTLTPLNPATATTTHSLVLSEAMLTEQGQMGMRWQINGKSYVMGETALSVKKDSTEIWEFRNERQSMPHPMHLHGFQFQVIERLNSPSQLKEQASYPGNRLATDLGWKDTVLVWPGETVRVVLNFSHNFQGEQNYVVHCHILEHEANGMMLNYRVS